MMTDNGQQSGVLWLHYPWTTNNYNINRYGDRQANGQLDKQGRQTDGKTGSVESVMC